MANGLLSGGATDSATVPQRTDTLAAGAPEAPEANGLGEEQPNVTPEEQGQYDQFVNNALLLIYDDNAMPALLKRFAAGAKTDPVSSLATVAVQIIDRLEGSAASKGAKIDPDVVMHGGLEILEDLANLAKEAQIHEFTDQELEAATYMAMDLYRNTKEQKGELDKAAVDQQFNELAQADKEGKLGEVSGEPGGAPGPAGNAPPAGPGR